MTVDEMLLGFRGRCPFRVYISNKPAKYGIKIFMANDSDSFYCLNAFPYLGKKNAPRLEVGENQGQHFTLQLLEDLKESGRTICLDNWFTSINLTKALQQCDMHLVGTIRTKPQLPQKEFLKSLPLEKKESFAIFNHTEKINVVYKKVKASKYVPIVTTLHNKFTDVEQKKTEAHMFYNASKGGTDAFDMMCAASSTSRKKKALAIMCLLWVAEHNPE